MVKQEAGGKNLLQRDTLTFETLIKGAKTVLGTLLGIMG